jgi:hypothetical protein
MTPTDCYGDGDGESILDNGILPNDNRPDGLFALRDIQSERYIQAYNDRKSVLRDGICRSSLDRGLPALRGAGLRRP